MSYQPFPATAAPPPAPAPGRRRPALLVIGIVVLVIGVVGGIALLVGAGASTENSVEQLGRAAPGCETTLKFDQTGTFVVFFERAGTVADLGCSTSGSFDRDDDTVPDQTLTLTDPDGNDVDITNASGVSYDAGGFVGEQIGEVEIDAKGDYVLAVTPDDASDTDYAIAIGKDPTANESTMRVAGAAVLVVGLLVGVLLVVLGLRRRPAQPAVPGPVAGGPPWGQVGVGPTVTWPPAAPTAPPYAGPPTSFGVPGAGPVGQPTPGAPASGDPTRVWPASAPGWPPAPNSPSADDTRQQPAPDPFSRPPGS